MTTPLPPDRYRIDDLSTRQSASGSQANAGNHVQDSVAIRPHSGSQGIGLVVGPVMRAPNPIPMHRPCPRANENPYFDEEAVVDFMSRCIRNLGTKKLPLMDAALREGDAESLRAIEVGCTRDEKRSFILANQFRLTQALNEAIKRGHDKAIVAYGKLLQTACVSNIYDKLMERPGIRHANHHVASMDQGALTAQEQAPSLALRAYRRLCVKMRPHSYGNAHFSFSNLNAKGLAVCRHMSAMLCRDVNRYRKHPDQANQAMKLFLKNWSAAETSISTLTKEGIDAINASFAKVIINQIALPVAAEALGNAIAAIGFNLPVQTAHAFPLMTINFSKESRRHVMTLVLIRYARQLKISVYDPNVSGNDVHLKVDAQDSVACNRLKKMTLADFFPDLTPADGEKLVRGAALVRHYCGNFLSLNIYMLNPAILKACAGRFAGETLDVQVDTLALALALASGNIFHMKTVVDRLERQLSFGKLTKSRLQTAIKVNPEKFREVVVVACRMNKTKCLPEFNRLLKLADISDQALLHNLFDDRLRTAIQSEIQNWNPEIREAWTMFFNEVPHLSPHHVAHLMGLQTPVQNQDGATTIPLAPPLIPHHAEG